MLEDSFANVYSKFKLHFYREIFSTFQDREASLTAVETFCMEVILALKEPTYKINNLIQKGYVEKIQSPNDRREYHLRPTQKYIEYYNISSSYLHSVMERVKKRFSPEEMENLDQMLQIVGRELMPEVDLR